MSGGFDVGATGVFFNEDGIPLIAVEPSGPDDAAPTGPFVLEIGEGALSLRCAQGTLRLHPCPATEGDALAAKGRTLLLLAGWKTPDALIEDVLVERAPGCSR